jgi:hypothetical protein
MKPLILEWEAWESPIAINDLEELYYVVLDPAVRATVRCKQKYAAVWNQMLYICEYSGINSLKLKNSGIQEYRT